MVANTERRQKYWQQWAVKRLDKRKYLLKNGILVRGLPVAIIVYFLKIRFSTDQFDLIDFLICCFLFCLMGILLALWDFKSAERGYQKFLAHQALQ
ncbi:hypothetical protein [Mucilaginibacter paludis]|uniref:Uncharacterized protein n=1 Tax=Mucilaginibacter paludis DSM 18603 TaxID=714943 RepID=H1Y9K9_9SPHI|nr:hypothetical protein [Mucilaginibacter paludis]EHQ30511.1 hypothetical protein Mucpa_6458 [Mucilaginibacter paludis DSM 18603]